LTDPAFLFAAALAVLLALAFVIAPLLGDRRRATLAILIIAVPVSTLAIYLAVGTPAGIQPDTGETGEVRSAVTDLANRAMREPDNAEHWARLGLAYKSLEEFASAEHAFRRALYINPEVPFLQAELGETLLYSSGERRLPDEARSLLEQAAESGSQKGLWLLGLDAFQREDYPDAAERFERLLVVLPADSGVRDTVRGYLVTARAGGPSARPEPASRSQPQDSEAGPSLALTVDIEEALARRLSGDETVFVAVRRASGGPPLAVRRLRAEELPAELNIDDGDAMMAGSGLSSADSISVVARVSFSGDAMPAEGDFEGQSGTVAVDQQTIRTEVVIDRVR
jgi:cytochrome c-type biogenesis protein CcmH